MKLVVRLLVLLVLLSVMAGCGKVTPTPPPGPNDGVKLTLDRSAMTKGVSAAAIDPRDYTGQRWLLITVATKYNEVYVEAPIRELKVGETLIPVTINLPARNDYIITALEFVKHDYDIKEGMDCEIIGFGTAHNIGIQNGETKIVNVVISPVQYEVDYPTVVESATPFNATLTFTASSSIDIDNAILTCGNDPDLLKTVHARSMNSVKYGNKWLTVASLSGSTKLVNEDCACTNLKIDVKLRHIDNYAWVNSSNQLKRSGVKFKIIIPGLALQHSALPNITIKKSTGGITF